MWLNLAEIALDVTTLGPGRRVGIWLQGCPFCCRGCIAPNWQAPHAEKLVLVEHVRDFVLSHPGHNGVTFSGGEPMLQARGALTLWRDLRSAQPEWTMVLFSGFTREEVTTSGRPDQQALLAAADAFVGGRYVEALNDGRGLRGSSNQEIWFPERTRFSAEEQKAMRNAPRKVELRLLERQLLLVGIPAPGWRVSGRSLLTSALDQRFPK